MKDNKLLHDDASKFLDYIILSVKEIINDDTMINKCDAVQGIIGRYLKEFDISIYPCNTQKQISNGVVGHDFLVADINDVFYLIDPTFIQFKYDKSNDLFIDNMKCKTYSPYHYAQIINKEACDNFIDKGYMELSLDNAFWYGNSFYRTKVGIPKDFKLMDINGDAFIKSFLLSDNPLSKYNEYKEIKDLKGNKR